MNNNKRLKPLLVVPRTNEELRFFSIKENLIPLGIAYLNGMLRTNRIPVECINLNFVNGSVSEVIYQTVKDLNPDIILCGGTLLEYRAIQNVFKAARNANPNILTVSGGSGISAEPILFSEMLDCDYSIVGEGEVTLLDLLVALECGNDTSQIAGLVFKNNGKYIKTNPRCVIENLDTIIFPSYEGLGIESLFEFQKNKYRYLHTDYCFDNIPRTIPMTLSRACPYNCKFCFHSLGSKYRIRTFDNFFAELEQWIAKYDINSFILHDGLFGINEKYILEFCYRVKEYKMNWVAQTRVEIASVEVLEAMKDAGCRSILFGFESYSQKILDDMNKKINYTDLDKAVANTTKVGIRFHANLLFGAEADDNETFETSFNWWNKHRDYGIWWFTIRVFPGSEYFKNSFKRRLITDTKQFIEANIPDINMTTLSSYDWNRIIRILNFMRIDKYNYGHVISIQSDKGEALLQCPKCNNKFNVSQVTSEILKSSIIFTCPNCHIDRNYTTKDYSFEQEIILKEQLECDKSQNLFIDRWIVSRMNYHRVAIVGSNSISDIFYSELLRFGIEAYQWKLKILDNGIFNERKIIKKDDDVNKLNLDAIIIADYDHYKKIVQYIRDIDYKGIIDFAVNAIFNIEYFIIDKLHS
ncbi:hypothetical protein AGMMS49938_16460 [Fibrobacterales bacterium]|nr:hypothetical protein AGMMS49938_16460 [Fibrobacterales bacterium]